MATPAQLTHLRAAGLALHQKHDSKEIAARARRGLVLKYLRDVAPDLAQQLEARTADRGVAHASS